MPDHPDHEQLAAFQAGDGDRRQRSAVEAHLDGCPSCAQVVASVDEARTRLAVLEEPELPAGLHDRLAAAVAEDTTRSILRPAPWYRRPVAWGAAAALVLAALVAVPLLDQTSEFDNRTAGGGGSGGGSEATQRAATAPEAADAADLPVFQVPGEVSAAVVGSRLASDSAARKALDSVTAGAAGSPGGQVATPGTPATPGPPTTSTAREDDGTTRLRSASPANLRSCLPAATAAADPTTRPLVAAFFVEGTYHGRPATVLVTASTGQPGRVDLWVFPRRDCSASPVATERVE